MKYSRKLRKIVLKLKSCTIKYCRISTIHGLRNIGAENAKWQESCFWILICSCGTLMTVIMLGKVWERFQQSPTMTTIQTNNYPVKNIPFPAVTICNLNKIQKSSFSLMAKKFEENGVNETELRNFVKMIPQVYSTRLGKLENEEVICKVMKKLGYTLESFLFDMSQPCAQFLIRCLWLGKEYNCSDMFDEVITPEGFCCSFNYHGTKVPRYENITIRDIWAENKSHWDQEMFLFVNEASTPLSGLTVVVDVDENNYFASIDSFFGSVVILHDSFQYPDMDSPKASVQPRSEAMIRLRPNVIESSKNVRSLRIYQRQCYFPEEYSATDGGSYSYESCTLDCKLYTFAENCNCIPFYYPNMMNNNVCTLEEMKCIRDYRVLASQDTGTATEEWTTGQKNHCRCLPSCNDFNYEWVIQTNDIRHDEYASPIFEGKLGNRSAISIFFEQNVCMKYKIESQVTWDSVIASFGGILGLCLGGSIISLIELLYYFLWIMNKTRAWNSQTANTAKSKQVFSKRRKRSQKRIFHTNSPISYLNNYLNCHQVHPWVE